jgi:outer membrane receptor for ferrienterochelin and colicins
MKMRNPIQFKTIGQTLSSALIVLLLLAVNLRATDPPEDLTGMGLEDLMKIKVDTVYAASKHSQKVSEAPASVTVITAEQIRRYGYRNMGDVLRAVSGFYTSYYRYTVNVGVRGFSRPGDYNSRILVMVDGHRVNDCIYDAAAIGSDFVLSMDLISRVEIIRGPGSSLYGASAFFAVINVITMKGDQLNGAQIGASGGSLETVAGSVAYGKHFKSGLDLVAQGSLYQSQGGKNLYFPEFDSPDTNHGIAENADQDQYEHLFANLNYKDFNVQALHSFRKKGLAAAPWGVEFNDPRNIAWDERSYFDFSYARNSADKKTGYFARTYFDRYVYRGDNMMNYSGEAGGPLTLNKDLDRGWLWGVDAKVDREIKKHRLTAGVEFRNTFQQDQDNYDASPYYSYFSDHRSSNNGGLYLQDEWRLSPKVLLNLGLRYDYYGTFGGTLNPRLNLIFNATGQSTLKFLYGRAFRAPTVYELYYQDSVTSKSNPNLNPETISTFEVSFERKMGDHLTFLASGYYSQLDHLIDQQLDPTDGFLIFANAGSAHARGVSVGMEGNWNERLECRFSYDYQQATDADSGEWLANSPRHLVKFNLSVPLWHQNLIPGLEVQGYSERKSRENNLIPGYAVANLTLTSRRFWKHLEAGISFYNLFDQKYSDPTSFDMRQESIPQDGRVLLARIKWFF